MPAIQADRVTKEYRLGALPGLRQTLLGAVARLAGRQISQRPLFKERLHPLDGKRMAA